MPQFMLWAEGSFVFPSKDQTRLKLKKEIHLIRINERKQDLKEDIPYLKSSKTGRTFRLLRIDES